MNYLQSPVRLAVSLVLGTSYRIAFRRLLLFLIRGSSPHKLVFLFNEKVEERVSSSIVWNSLTQGCTILRFKLGLDPLAERYLFMMTHKRA